MEAGVLRKTPLNAVHRELGAKMVAFGGWEMPVEYSGLIAEHMAVRTAAGLFDVSHMGRLEVEGAGALSFLQRVTSNNVARLADGQAQYSALPMPNGAPVDDVIVSRKAADRYLLVVNAGNVEKDLRWLQSQGPTDCRLGNRSDESGLLALQGPRAAEILQAVTPLDLTTLGYYRHAEAVVAGWPTTLSRTGYTGEDGFELLIASDRVESLWRRLLEEGNDKGLVPAGLGARDTLRLEARLCLYGKDIDESTSLVEAGLGWIVSSDEAKGDFIGRAVLEAQRKDGPTRKLVGFEMTGRGIARHGYLVWVKGREAGTVTSGTYAPFLEKNIGLCYLPAEHAVVGVDFDVDIRGRRVPARVVPTPFYKRAK